MGERRTAPRRGNSGWRATALTLAAAIALMAPVSRVNGADNGPLAASITIYPYLADRLARQVLPFPVKALNGQSGLVEDLVYCGSLNAGDNSVGRFLAVLEPVSTASDRLLLQHDDCQRTVDDVFRRVRALSGVSPGVGILNLQGRFQGYHLTLRATQADISNTPNSAPYRLNDLPILADVDLSDFSVSLVPGATTHVAIALAFRDDIVQLAITTPAQMQPPSFQTPPTGRIDDDDAILSVSPAFLHNLFQTFGSAEIQLPYNTTIRKLDAAVTGADTFQITATGKIQRFPEAIFSATLAWQGREDPRLADVSVACVKPANAICSALASSAGPQINKALQSPASRTVCNSITEDVLEFSRSGRKFAYHVRPRRCLYASSQVSLFLSVFPVDQCGYAGTVVAGASSGNTGQAPCAPPAQSLRLGLPQ
jgi:hypothetical protein